MIQEKDLLAGKITHQEHSCVTQLIPILISVLKITLIRLYVQIFTYRVVRN